MAAFDDDGVQIMDVTNPAQPYPVSAVFDGPDIALDSPDDVEVFGSGDGTYAIVASGGDGVQILDITYPINPVPASAAFDGTGGFEALGGADGVEVFGNGDRTYAIVAAFGDGGVQIMDITNPAQPYPLWAVFDGPEFPALGGANGVEVFWSGGRAYAIVAARSDGGVQIMDIGSADGLADVSADLHVANPAGAGMPIMTIADPIHPAPASAVLDGSRDFTQETLPQSGIAVTSITLDSTRTLRDFDATLSCGGNPAAVTEMTVAVDGWQEDIAEWAEFDLTILDGSGDHTPDVRVGFAADGTLNDAAYPLYLSGADLRLSGTLPAAGSISMLISYHTVAGGSCHLN